MQKIYLLLLVACCLAKGEARSPAWADRCDVSLATGMSAVANDRLSEFARIHKLNLIMLPSNPHSLPYQGQEGYQAKPAELKYCKSARQGKNIGLVECPPSSFSDREAWEKAKAKLAVHGYKVLGEQDEYLVIDENHSKFHSDYDLLGVYDSATGRDVYTEDLRLLLNQFLGGDFVRHAPLDQYKHRFDIGVTFPLSQFRSDGGFSLVQSRDQWLDAYKSIHVDWNAIWGEEAQLSLRK